MKPAFVETENVARFQQALSALEKRGADEACLVVVDGVPGLGKTTIIKHWVAQTGCVYLRAKKEWTPSWMMAELLQRLNVQPPHAFEKKYKLALQTLGSRQQSAAYDGRPFSVVIDEADHISRQERIMETLRDLSDVIELPFILVGMGRIRDNLTRFPQIASRISQYCRFEPATVQDVERFMEAQCEFYVADDLVRFVHRVTSGFNREIREAIANIERFAGRNAPEARTSENAIELADMAGEIIVNDRKTGEPIRVPEMV